MSTESIEDRIFDLLAQWSAARESGTPLTVEELCRDCPELVNQVRDRVHALEHMQWLDQSIIPGAPVSTSQSLTDPSAIVDLDVKTVRYSESTESKAQPGSIVRYIGDYELLAEIARGGMGIVYQARQVRLKRVVALKMILAGSFASSADVQRFHTEAESAAQLDHPNIVPVFEVGEFQGLHYFSMGYVDGASLSHRLSTGPLPPRAAAEMIRTVASAVHYAHGKGVIHRDLKPGNILIDKAGQPRVTDFGLAKRSQPGASDLTGTGQILGTPSYMPPEQALGRTGLVREAADIYSLGAVLYATLTGRPPFQADNPIDTLRQVLEREPVPPRHLNPAVPLDLETICLKCLDKNSLRRYRSAGDLADELGRFLDGKPIQARPVSTVNRAWRWCLRNRLVAMLLAAVAVSLIAGTVISSYFAIESNQRAIANLKLAKDEKDARDDADKRKTEALTAKDLAEEKTRDAKREAANFALNQAENLCDKQESNVGILWMVKAHGLALEARDDVLADACRAMVSARLVYVPRLERYVAVTGGNVVSAFGPDDKTILVAGKGALGSSPFGLKIFDAQSNELLDHVPAVRSAGSSLAMNADRTRVLLQDDQDRVRMWSLELRDWVGEELRPVGPVDHAAFSPRRDLLATATMHGEIELWSAETGKPTGVRVTHPINYPMPWKTFYRVCFNGPGHVLYGGGYQRTNMIAFDVGNGAMLSGFPKNTPNYVTSFATYPGLVACANKGLQIHHENDQLTIGGQTPEEGYVYSMDYSRDGRWLATTGRENRVTVRNGMTAQSMGTGIAGVSTSTAGIQFREDNRQLLASLGPTVQLWQSPKSLFSKSLELVPADPKSIRFRVKDKFIAGLDRDGFPYVQADAPQSKVEPDAVPPIELPSVTPWRIILSPNHRYVIVQIMKGLLVADFKTGRFQLNDKQPVTPPGTNLIDLICCPLSKRALSRINGTIQMWDLESAGPVGEAISISQKAHEADKHCPLTEFSPDGQFLGVLMDRRKGEFRVYRTLDGTLVGKPLFLGSANRTAWHPDGKRLLVAIGSQVEIWDFLEGVRRNSLPSHDGSIFGIKLSPDGKYIAIGGTDQTVRVREVDSGKLVGSPIRKAGTNVEFTFSPDGQLLGLAGLTSDACFFHTLSGRQVTPIIQAWRHNLDVAHFRPSKSGFSRVFVSTQTGVSYPFFAVPQNHEQLELFVEAWSNLTLDGNDVRVLSRDEWKKRCLQLRALGWQDEHTKVKALDGPLVDHDRAAAEWVLASGGSLRISNAQGNRAIKTLQELPAEPFQVTSIVIKQAAAFDVRTMAALRLLGRLEVLDLSGSGITDDALQQLSRLPALRRVTIANTEVTDEGLKHLKNFPTIEHLTVSGDKHTARWLADIASHGRLQALSIHGRLVGSEGLESLAQCSELVTLDLGDKVTDATCESIGKLANLRTLVLQGTLSVSGARHLATLRALSYLNIKSEPVIDDAVLVELIKGHPTLDSLILHDQACTTTGLKSLEQLTKLRFLKLGCHSALTDELAETLLKLKTLRALELRNALTTSGIAQLTQAHPQCKITSMEHGEFGPSEPDDPDRVIANWALNLGCNVTVLPGKHYQSGQSRNVSEKGIVRVYSMRLVGSKIGDAELPKVTGLTSLTRFVGDRIELTDAAAPHLARIHGLEQISLVKTKITDAALEHLANIATLTHLSLAETKVSDAGLKLLASCKTLKVLDLRQTVVTAVGLAEFKKAVPDCLVRDTVVPK